MGCIPHTCTWGKHPIAPDGSRFYYANMNAHYITRVQRLLLSLLVTALLAIVVAGCRTAHGFGEDMQKAGEEIQSGTD